MTFEAPTITDDDIAWVCRVMGLPPNAFHGDGTDDRAAILKSNRTLDVEACPGSGKTTLLVAKLAILARHWKNRRRGICVLSHTNVARAEIEKRLGATVEGQSLLRYPHFIGTIHGFVNEFLALPYMRSQLVPVEVIDTDIALNSRWKKLPGKTRSALEKNHVPKSALEYTRTSCEPGTIRWGRGSLGRETPTFQAIHKACLDSCLQGIHCHGELFVWAEECLQLNCDVAGNLRHRFPMLFIDEVQDTDEGQARMLHSIFMAGEGPVTRQRFGDSNQAIFQTEQDATAITDPFPNEVTTRDIRKSFRFNQDIADLADPFGVWPQGLVGAANSINGLEQQSYRNAVFLFDEDAIHQVIPAFGDHLEQELCSGELNSGRFVAVGGVHRWKDGKANCVGRYWAEYCPSNLSQDIASRNFVAHLIHGRARSRSEGHASASVQALASAILRAIGLTDRSKRGRPMRSPNRNVVSLLDGIEDSLTDYRELVEQLCHEAAELIENSWCEVYEPRIRKLLFALCETEELSKATEEFLKWPTDPETSAPPVSGRENNNFQKSDSCPRIEIGSIHSIKGETHTATLVLDTFYHDYHFKVLKPWLLGNSTGLKKKNPRNALRLRLHYVAMTRPSKILCLAIQKSIFTDSEVARLKARGWCVAHVREERNVWL